jgi:hypothetical protein
MPNTALVFEIVFENENTFCNISKEECKLLLDTSCSMCMKNTNILGFMQEQTINYTNRKLKAKTEDFFQKFDRNTISLFFAKAKKNEETIHKYELIETTLMEEINSSLCKDLFRDLFIAEYKEKLYDFENTLMEIEEISHLNEFERIAYQYYGLHELYNHIHDPDSFMYNDGKHYYSFYENIEKYGDCILDLFNMTDNGLDGEFTIEDEEFD